MNNQSLKKTCKLLKTVHAIFLAPTRHSLNHYLNLHCKLWHWLEFIFIFLNHAWDPAKSSEFLSWKIKKQKKNFQLHPMSQLKSKVCSLTFLRIYTIVIFWTLWIFRKPYFRLVLGPLPQKTTHSINQPVPARRPFPRFRGAYNINQNVSVIVF